MTFEQEKTTVHGLCVVFWQGCDIFKKIKESVSDTLSKKWGEGNEKRNDKSIQKIVENSIKGVNPFIEYLNKVSIIYNEPIEILMDNNNLYLIEGEN